MKILITPEKKWFSASIDEYNIHTQGDNFDELILNIQDAIHLYKSCIDDWLIDPKKWVDSSVMQSLYLNILPYAGQLSVA